MYIMQKTGKEDEQMKPACEGECPEKARKGQYTWNMAKEDALKYGGGGE
jgi:hypothetical protein